MISVGTNALASAIVLSLRSRPDGAPVIDRRGFIAALESELPDALRKLQQGQIAPVTCHKQQLVGHGCVQPVQRSSSNPTPPDDCPRALARINEILDRVSTNKRATSTRRHVSLSCGIAARLRDREVR